MRPGCRRAILFAESTSSINEEYYRVLMPAHIYRRTDARRLFIVACYYDFTIAMPAAASLSTSALNAAKSTAYI